jgi:hypothetical protein
MKRTDQLGRLGLITAASGWDIKLRELVMREATMGDPEEDEKKLKESIASNNKRSSAGSGNSGTIGVGIVSGGLKQRLARPNSGFSNRSSGSGGSHDDASSIHSGNDPEKPISPASSPNSFKRRQSAPFHASRFSTSSSVNANIGEDNMMLPLSPAAENLAFSNDDDIINSQPPLPFRARAKSSGLEHIVQGFDERLREIVMEAANKTADKGVSAVGPTGRRRTISGQSLLMGREVSTTPDGDRDKDVESSENLKGGNVVGSSEGDGKFRCALCSFFYDIPYLNC